MTPLRFLFDNLLSFITLCLVLISLSLSKGKDNWVVIFELSLAEKKRKLYLTGIKSFLVASQSK